MTNTAIHTRMTQEYDAASSGIPADRAHVALVAGSGPVAPDDLYQLLRRRLLILNSILACTLLVSIAVSLLMQVIEPRDEGLGPPTEDLIDWLLRNWRILLFLTISTASVVILWRRPPANVFGLRLIEFVVVGTLVLLFLITSVSAEPYRPLVEASAEPARIRSALIGRYINGGGLVWFFVLTAYGALIPNTLRRCAVMTIGIAVSPLALFAVYGFWLQPLDPGIVIAVLIALGVSNTAAVAIVLFASSRIEILRRQAAEARKLGQYVLKEQLGAGGMGEVYRAEHVLLRRPCAIKIIRSDRAGDAKNLLRFEREVQVTATLTHPNTVQIFDYGHAADGTFYYVMEFLPGLTLEELVKQEGPLAPARAIHFLRQVCAALREAHQRGLIHRDIKPGNVMICERGGIHDVAKLLDFGLVLPPVSDLDGGKLTQDGSITGTPAYLSPEQADGQESLDGRSDIYSVGAMAYFLLTGQPPFHGRSAVKMLAAHLYEEPQPLATHRSDVPADLEIVIRRCMAKDPTERFADAESLSMALAACHAAGLWTEGNTRLEWCESESADVQGAIDDQAARITQ